MMLQKCGPTRGLTSQKEYGAGHIFQLAFSKRDGPTRPTMCGPNTGQA